MKRKLWFSTILALAALLLSAAQVMAAPLNDTPAEKDNQKKSDAATSQDNEKGQNKGKPEHFKGVLEAVTDASITVKLADGSSVTIGLDPSTRIKVPTLKGAGPADLLAGMQVTVQARTVTGGSPVAKMVLVIPGKPVAFHRVGKVTAYTLDSSITIIDKNGESWTFTLTGTTKILPKHRAATLAVDSVVTIISRRNPAAGPASPLMAQGIVIHGSGETEGDDSGG